MPTCYHCGGGGKCDGDAAQWLPQMNRCWFAARAVAVKRKYGLTVDQHEAEALGDILSDCDTTDMVVTTGAVPIQGPSGRPGRAWTRRRRVLRRRSATLPDSSGPAAGVHSLHAPSALATSCCRRLYPPRRTRLIRLRIDNRVERSCPTSSCPTRTPTRPCATSSRSTSPGSSGRA